MDYASWYHKLNKPFWAPKDWAFGVAWSILYPIIIVVNVYVTVLLVKGKIGWLIALPFWLNLFFNIIFSPIQFNLKNNSLALADAVLILVTTIWAMLAIWPHNRLLAFAFVPYLIWVCIAVTLQAYIVLHN